MSAFSPSQQEWPSYGLRNLWDMIRQVIWRFVHAGMRIQHFQGILDLLEQRGDDPRSLADQIFNGTRIEDMNETEKENLLRLIDDLIELTGELDLNVSQTLLFSAKSELPKTEQAFMLIVLAIKREMFNKLFLHIPADRASYFEKADIVSENVRNSFPSAYIEIKEAATCYATERYTACVFHAMRGAEIGLRAMGNDLCVTFPDKPIELAEWQNILDKIEKNIKKKLEASGDKVQRDKDRQFYGQAAAQFRYFKDGWRIRVAHARERYIGSEALNVLNHAREFFETLATRLRE
jgi:hypothetical protein